MASQMPRRWVQIVTPPDWCWTFPRQYLLSLRRELQPEKDIPSLIAAMAIVVRTLPDAMCVVAGEGDQRDWIEHEVTRLKLGNRVQLLGFRQDMDTLFAACDIFVLPSLAEPFGLVLLEAMSHGRAVIGTRAGGPLEIIAEGETGLLVPPGGASSLAKAILQLLLNRDESDAMGRKGIVHVREQFSAGGMARKVAAVYNQAMQSPPI